jgi:hypothetical protein
VPALDAALGGARARYSNGANVAWIAWPDDRDLAGLDAALLDLGLPGMPLTGAPAGPLLGARHGGAFLERLRSALDPDRRFLEI